MATDHDQLFKQLLRVFTVEFILLFLPEVAKYIDPTGITFMETEVFTDLVTGERYRADVVIKARFKASAGAGAEGAFFIIHVEPQGKNQEDFPRRMFTSAQIVDARRWRACGRFRRSPVAGRGDRIELLRLPRVCVKPEDVT